MAVPESGAFDAIVALDMEHFNDCKHGRGQVTGRVVRSGAVPTHHLFYGCQYDISTAVLSYFLRRLRLLQ
ncbi:hypothetical protein EVAR_67888_1 [Eumeta japonica]|uniref:Uncharacterized protein n=1 Tax=Eumeta variegata TaxID=151549 RepID=A0A4C1YW66_EUMVA|nr:hypothetical protein EVAR_67888_1 [Eumeta japonica]